MSLLKERYRDLSEATKKDVNTKLISMHSERQINALKNSIIFIMNNRSYISADYQKIYKFNYNIGCIKKNQNG